MRFAEIKGNEEAVAALRAMVDSGRVPHAMLFYENPASGGMALANAFVQYLGCEHRHDGDSCGSCPSCIQTAKLIHPDVHYVFPVNKGDVIKSDKPVSSDGMGAFRELFASNPYFTEQQLYETLGIESKAGNISVAEAKEIVSSLALTSLTGGYKAIIMFLPERMNPAAANKLLKMIEEPPAKTVFLLVTQDPRSVLTTVTSRCQGLRVLPFDRSQLVCGGATEDVEAVWEGLLNALMSHSLSGALKSVDALDALKSREKQKAFCTFASEQLRKIFLTSRKLEDLAYFRSDQERSTAQAAVKVLPANYYSRSIAALDNAAMLIGRNVASKMVFTELVNRLYELL